MNTGLKYLFFAFFFALLYSCNSSTRLFTKKTAREHYEEALKKQWPKNDPTVQRWINAGKYALSNPFPVTNNYSETGRIEPADSSAVAFLISVKRGQKLSVSLTGITDPRRHIYTDIWKVSATPEFLNAADTLTNSIDLIPNEDMQLIIRMQAALNFNGNYSLHMYTGPSLQFPIAAGVKAPIGSVWNDARDGGVRKHEGVDIMAPKHSYAVAAADGVVSSVSENDLGGKTVSMRPDGSNFSLYYAHLDSQMVQDGQHVRSGDVLGLTGNTGNAKNTVSHLHFGIYTNTGAIDPLLFIKPVLPQKITETGALANGVFTLQKKTQLFTEANKSSSAAALKPGDIVRINAVSENFYRITLANGGKGFVLKNAVKLK